MQHGANVFSVDIGTSSLKAGIIDSKGDLLWHNRCPMLESDADLLSWKASRWIDALKSTVSRMPDTRIDAVVISGNGPTIVALDAHDDPVFPVLLWTDGRFDPIPGNSSFFLPKIRWFETRHPESAARVRKYLSCPEYVCYLLTGEAVAIVPTRAFQPFIWDAAQTAAYGTDEGRLPPFVPAGSLIGRISARGAETSGLPTGVPVYAGGTDFIMSLIGTGTIRPGMICDRAGTSEGINFCSEKAVEHRELRTLPHAVEGLFNIAGILSSTGRMFEWFRRFSGQEDTPYDAMVRRIEAVEKWSDLPFFFPSARRGELYEFDSAVFSNLHPFHGSPEMGRAVVESIGFTIKRVLATLETAGCTADTLRICGGQAKNPRWNQMKADMIGKIVEVPKIQDAELTGCAVHGFIGLGVFAGIEEAVQELVRIEYRVDPNPEMEKRYTERFGEYEIASRNIAQEWKGDGSRIRPPSP